MPGELVDLMAASMPSCVGTSLGSFVRQLQLNWLLLSVPTCTRSKMSAEVFRGE